MMDPSTAAYSARLLTLHEDLSFIGRLSTSLQSKISALTIEHCLNAHDAKKRLFESSCHAVIVSPPLIIHGDVSVLTSSQRARPPVPLLMTLRDDEREVAQHWLDFGVYDFIFDSFDPREAIRSVQDALQLSRTRAMIQRTEEALLRLRGRREAYQTNAADTSLRNEIDILLKRSIVRLEESKDSIEETFMSLERTLNQLKQNRRENEIRAQQRAQQRLGRGLSK